MIFPPSHTGRTTNPRTPAVEHILWSGRSSSSLPSGPTGDIWREVSTHVSGRVTQSRYPSGVWNQRDWYAIPGPVPTDDARILAPGANDEEISPVELNETLHDSHHLLEQLII